MASAEALFSRNVSTSPKLQNESRPDQPDGANETVVNKTPKSTPKQDVVTDTTTHVTFAGEDAECIPKILWTSKGAKAISLDLSYNKLSTLEGLENFPNLEELVLDNNNLTDSVLVFPNLPHLHTLTLNKNQIEDIETLLTTLVKQCPSLRYLSLLGNRACPNELLRLGHDDEDYQRYRYYVLHQLPNLTFLDSRPVSSAEKMEAKRVGAFMQVVRPDDKLLEEGKKKKRFSRNSSTDENPVPSGFNPLPASKSVVGQHRGVYGQCKYVYYGKHSEGNRFIRNQHL